MKPAPAIMVAALLSGLVSCLGSHQANACIKPIDLVAIEQRIADPNLGNELAGKATTLKMRAAAAIEAGQREEGRRMYRQLESLLGMHASSGPHRCN